MKIFEIKKDISAKKADLRSLVTVLESRELTPEESERFDSLQNEVVTLKARVEKMESVDTEEDSEEPEARSTKPIAIEAPAVHTRKHTYSIAKALGSVLTKGKVSGLEKEMSDEVALRDGRSPQGFYVPYGEVRDLTTSTGVGALKTEYDSSIIMLLQNQNVMAAAGATVLTGLQGTFSMPAESATTNAYWVAEGVAPTESASAFTSITMSPKTVGAWTTASRKFILQASISVESYLREALSSCLAREIDRAAINGSGSGAEPTGLLTYSGITTVGGATNGQAVTYANLIAMETAVNVANASAANMAYVSNSKVLGYLKTTPKIGSTYPIYLYEGADNLNGYKFLHTNQMPSDLTKAAGTALSGIVFGNFKDLVIGYWGSGVDLLVDPYSESTSGNVRFVALADVDIKVRRTASFSRIVDAITT